MSALWNVFKNEVHRHPIDWILFVILVLFGVLLICFAAWKDGDKRATEDIPDKPTHIKQANNLDVVSESDPLVYLEFTDARSTSMSSKREDQAYFTVVNRGGREAKNIILEPIELHEFVVQFTRHRLAAPLLPKREAYFSPDVVTKDNKSAPEIEKDLFHLFYMAYHDLGDETICEATTVVIATYQDSARNLFEVSCELVIDPAAHNAVRMGGRITSPVIFTRNHKFRKVAFSLIEGKK